VPLEHSANGIAATEQVRAALPGTQVLVLTMCDRDEYACAPLRAGASGFLGKDTPAAEMLVASAACCAATR
jgi:DNA-binding NarL/FixJ family response regulator